MASKFNENKQFLSTDRNFMISTSHEYELLEHKQVPNFEDISHLKELKRRLEEKENKLLKEKLKISEERSLVIQQDNILEDMQTKINHLEEQLQHPELIGLIISKELLNQVEVLGAGSSQQREKVAS